MEQALIGTRQFLKQLKDWGFKTNPLNKTIKSIKDEKAEEDADGVLHKGISKRQFSRTFTIADDVEVKAAELKDGLLKVSLEKIIPDSKKPRTIQIK